MGTITVSRAPGGGALGLVISVDGEKVGRVRPNKSLSHEVAAGTHEVQVKRGWAHVEAEITLGEGEDAEVFCSEASGFSSRGEVSPGKVVRALANNGGLNIWVEEDEQAQ